AGVPRRLGPPYPHSPCLGANLRRAPASEALTPGQRADAADGLVAHDVEGAAVVAEDAVAGVDAGGDGAQVPAVGGQDEYAAGAGGEDVTIFVHLHAVRQALLLAGPLGGVEEDAALAEGAVLADGEALPVGEGGVGVGDVEGPLVGRQGDAVGLAHLLGEQ